LDISLIKSFILGIIEKFPIETPANTFAKGADISWLPQMEANGYKFYNNKGIQQDCLHKQCKHNYASKNNIRPIAY
jgi:arabinogalactan endo-1,4-beta-galactosidase